jgi:hypothetical protein
MFGRLEGVKTYQNRIVGKLSALLEKNGKSFGRLQASALWKQD